MRNNMFQMIAVFAELERVIIRDVGDTKLVAAKPLGDTPQKLARPI